MSDQSTLPSFKILPDWICNWLALLNSNTTAIVFLVEVQLQSHTQQVLQFRGFRSVWFSFASSDQPFNYLELTIGGKLIGAP